MNQIIKPGYKTTEFWTVIIGYVLAFFATSGLIDAEKANQLTGALPALIAAGIPFIAAAVNVYYIMSRKEVKKEALRNSAQGTSQPGV